VPTLGNHILEELDVESLTLQLQQHGTNGRAPATQDLTTSSASIVTTEGITNVTADTAPIPSSLPELIQPEPPQRNLALDVSAPQPIMPIADASSWVQEFTSAQTNSSLEPLRDGDTSPASTYLSISDSGHAEEPTTTSDSIVSTTSEQAGDEEGSDGMVCDYLPKVHI